MADHQGEPDPRDRDPWAPPAESAAQGGPAGPGPSSPSQGGVPLDKPSGAPAPPSPHVHNMPTVASMPGVDPLGDAGAVPPPPIAPGGPAQPAAGPYGYPGTPNPAHTVPGAVQPYGAYAPYPGYPQSGWHAGALGPNAMGVPQNNMGVASLVLGILSVALFCVYGIVGLVLGVLALIFGVIGRKRVSRGQATNPGQALAGIILGSIGLVIALIFIAFMIWAIVETGIEEESGVDEYDGTYSSTLVIDSTGPAGPLTTGLL
ncbi:DUF4190 domain-containing protein [Streptomyces sp. NPDC004726]